MEHHQETTNNLMLHNRRKAYAQSDTAQHTHIHTQTPCLTHSHLILTNAHATPYHVYGTAWHKSTLSLFDVE